MTLHVCILGIDGSGKSTISAALPTILAAEAGLVAGAAGETFRVSDPDEDHLAPKFHPDGLPVSARLTTRFKRLAKGLVDSRRLYPGVQDRADGHARYRRCSISQALLRSRNN